MPIVETDNGPVMVEDGTPPEVIARIKADAARAAKSKPKAAPKKLTADEQEITRRVEERRKVERPGAGAVRHLAQGYTFNVMDDLVGAGHAVTNAVRNRSLDGFGHEFHIAREVERQRMRDSGGNGGTAAEIAGALLNPLGTGSKLLQATKAAPAMRLASRIDRAGPIAQAALAGANQGALNSAGSANNSDEILTRLAQGGFVGALTGGAIGGGVHLSRRAVQILADREGKNAGRVAYDHISEMLNKAGISPARAERELSVSGKRGTDAMLMDLSPGMRAQAAAISRRPNVPASNELIERSEQRIEQRPGSFEDEIRRAIKPKSGQEADEALDAIHGARKAHGNASYDDVLDKNFVWNDDLEKFVKEAPEPTRRALQNGVRLIQAERKDPTALGINFDAEGNVAFAHTPSMRVFDYMKRGFDQEIGAAIRGGDRNMARILSGELNNLKYGIVRSNPEYANVLATQHDFFQRAEAVEMGQDVLKRLRKEPKAVLKDLRAMPPEHHDLARTGIVDAIIGLRSSKADPVQYLRGLMRSPPQRKVLEFLFDGRGNLSRFERYMNRELRSKKADVLIAPGRQSETARFQAADDSLNEGVQGIAEHGLRGFAFGGPAGASAAVVRKLNDLRTGVTNEVLDEMARILAGKGGGLKEGTSAAKAFAKARQTRNVRAAVRAAKGGQQPFTSFAGDQ